MSVREARHVSKCHRDGGRGDGGGGQARPRGLGHEGSFDHGIPGRTGGRRRRCSCLGGPASRRRAIQTSPGSVSHFAALVRSVPGSGTDPGRVVGPAAVSIPAAGCMPTFPGPSGEPGWAVQIDLSPQGLQVSQAWWADPTSGRILSSDEAGRPIPTGGDVDGVTRASPSSSPSASGWRHPMTRADGVRFRGRRGRQVGAWDVCSREHSRCSQAWRIVSAAWGESLLRTARGGTGWVARRVDTPATAGTCARTPRGGRGISRA